MRQGVLLFFLLVPFSAAVSQTPQSMQATTKATSQPTKWTDDDERAFLAKALQGDAGSQMWLACAYEQGWFGKTNFPEALKWFRKSAEQDNPTRKTTLGEMYEKGEGVTQSYALAAKWYRMAAEHVPNLGGAGQGRNNLRILYADGDGVPKDSVQAYMWFSLAGSNDNIVYTQHEMTPDQISRAQKLAADWKLQHPDPAIY